MQSRIPGVVGKTGIGRAKGGPYPALQIRAVCPGLQPSLALKLCLLYLSTLFRALKLELLVKFSQ